jgi:hypothetical protein
LQFHSSYKNLNTKLCCEQINLINLRSFTTKFWQRKLRWKGRFITNLHSRLICEKAALVLVLVKASFPQLNGIDFPLPYG